MQMHHLAVKSNLVDTGPDNKLGFGCSNPPLCPKPRRLGSSVPEFLKTLGCSNHSQLNSSGRTGVLNMIINEKTTDEGESLYSSGCSLPCYSGSPPGRTSNPLVNDVQFVHQMEHYSPLNRTKLPEKFGFTSASPA
ncbi:hypothetical protein ACH5RR_011908 [Cinchona calisaya]|uniref:Uncharacterized protein n=1 Tax=Cinchona calisaya TaxID=153742 RepID=A0ABD3A9V5_9GENT